MRRARRWTLELVLPELDVPARSDPSPDITVLGTPSNGVPGVVGCTGECGFGDGNGEGSSELYRSMFRLYAACSSVLSPVVSSVGRVTYLAADPYRFGTSAR